MDLLKVNKDNYLPEGRPIEGLSSLIWTERFRDAGEFELKTARVDETLALLPEMSFVALRESREVMIVERHQIDKTAGYPVLTIKGRTLDAFLENRALEGPVSNKKYYMPIKYTNSEAASLLIWNAIVNPTDEDITRVAAPKGSHDPLDKIPFVVVTDSSETSDPKKKRWLKGGSVYPQILDVLRRGRLGLRIVRPPSGPAIAVDYDEETESGVVTERLDNVARLRFDVYNGTDRRANRPNAVIFTTAKRDLTEDQYLRSIEALKTMVMIVPGKLDARRYYRDRASDKDLSGWDRRVTWLDGGEPDLEEIPEKPDEKDTTADDIDKWREKRDRIKERNAQTMADFREDLRDMADVEFEKSDRVKLLDAKVSELSPFKYNRDYFLGDKVTFIGDYGFREDMQVVEYVRAFDGKTEQGYPGLAVIN